MTIAIVAAMPEELAPLRARLSGPVRTQPTSLRAVVVERGQLGGHDVALAATGDGARNARAGVAALLGASGARALVVIGVSGALSPQLATADLIVASRVTDEEGVVHEAEAESVAAATRATGGRAAVIVSARRIADSVDEKRRLAQQAGGGLAVVDLESASYVAAAVAAGIPWLVLRAVSDGAGEALPPLLNRSLDAGGAVSRGRVLRGLLGDPGALPLLLTLRKRVAECALVLARAAEATLPACLAARGAA
jgi:adenosylhomocysteine nucleosidase